MEGLAIFLDRIGVRLPTEAEWEYAARGAAYPAISSANVEYVGFRTAIGSIKSGQYTNRSSVTNSAPPAVISTTRTSIRNFISHSNAKACFVNVYEEIRNLCYVDFSIKPVTVTEITDTIGVFNPVISPDGTKAAFCTKGEGLQGKSSVYIRNLDEQGSGLVKLEPDLDSLLHSILN